MLIPTTTYARPTQSAVSVTLNTNTAVGATTFTVNSVPSGLTVGAIIAVDCFTSQCELRQVTGVSGTTITVSRLLFAHASGDSVTLINDYVVPTSFFNLQNDTTDQWQILQRLFKETTGLLLAIQGRHDVEEFYFQQPLVLDTNSRVQNLRVRTRTGFAPVESVGAAIMVGNGSFYFTASAGSDTFTSTTSDYSTPTASGLSNDIEITFSNPYGETLPGGITSGKVYYVKSTPTGSTFTISATQGGSTLDVTSDGTGWSVNNPTSGLARVFWDSLHLALTIADLNGVWMSLQQPSWTSNTRIDMTGAATSDGSAVGLILTGQISNHENVEINTWTNCHGMRIGGTGHLIRGFSDNGHNDGDTAIKFVNADSCGVAGLWTEAMGKVGVEIADTTRGAVLGGPWLHAPTTVGIPALLVSGSQTSFEVGMIFNTAGGGLIVEDTSGRDYTIDNDSAGIFSGLYQLQGVVAPTLKLRQTVTTTTTPYAVQREDEYIIVNTAAGNKTVTLPPVAGTKGWTVTVENAPDSGTNTVTIDADSTELIDLATTFVLNVYEAATLVSNGSRWLVVSHRLPGETALQTYTPTNVTPDRAFDADTVVITELADVVGTLIADLKTRKIIQ